MSFHQVAQRRTIPKGEKWKRKGEKWKRKGEKWKQPKTATTRKNGLNYMLKILNDFNDLKDVKEKGQAPTAGACLFPFLRRTIYTDEQPLDAFPFPGRSSHQLTQNHPEQIRHKIP